MERTDWSEMDEDERRRAGEGHRVRFYTAGGGTGRAVPDWADAPSLPPLGLPVGPVARGREEALLLREWMDGGWREPNE